LKERQIHLGEGWQTVGKAPLAAGGSPIRSCRSSPRHSPGAGGLVAEVFVGREQELAELSRARGRAEAGEPQVVALLAERVFAKNAVLKRLAGTPRAPNPGVCPGRTRRGCLWCRLLEQRRRAVTHTGVERRWTPVGDQGEGASSDRIAHDSQRRASQAAAVSAGRLPPRAAP